MWPPDGASQSTVTAATVAVAVPIAVAGVVHYAKAAQQIFVIS